ncbi:MAG: hypothetical protein LBQ31_02680 [Bacteroidales bacterium]|jgi:hypothetical protein|nr:hypothetical protein [Bacteroidales bacterium]
MKNEKILLFMFCLLCISSLQAQCNIEFLALIRTKDYTIKKLPAPFYYIKIFSEEAADTLIFYDHRANETQLYFPTIRVYTAKRDRPYVCIGDYSNIDERLYVTKVRTKGLHESNSNSDNIIKRKPMDSNSCIFDVLDKYLWLYYTDDPRYNVSSRTILKAWSLRRNKRIVSSQRSPIIIVYPSVVFFKQALDSNEAEFYSAYERYIRRLNEYRECRHEHLVNIKFINCLLYNGEFGDLQSWLRFKHGPRKKE